MTSHPTGGVNRQRDGCDAGTQPTGLGLVAVCDAQQQVQGVFTTAIYVAGWLAAAHSPRQLMSDDGRRHHVAIAKSRHRRQRILMKRKITAAPVVDENGKLTAQLTCRISIRPGLFNPSFPAFRQPMQVGDVGFQHPRAGSQL